MAAVLFILYIPEGWCIFINIQICQNEQGGFISCVASGCLKSTKEIKATFTHNVRILNAVKAINKSRANNGATEQEQVAIAS